MQTFVRRLFNFSLFGLIAIIAVGLLYVALDPFKVIYRYDTLIETDVKGRVTLNQDYVSTTTFINNSKKVKYNSFIFGSSRSIFYQIIDWKKFLSQNASCYHFDASDEALWAINKKIEFIDTTGNKIENILLVLDYRTLVQSEPKSGHLFIISPSLVNNSNIIDFHMSFFLAFLSPRFLFAFLDYQILGQERPYMKQGFLLDFAQRNYDTLTNEQRFDYFENLIRRKKYYTPERLSVFYERDTTIQKYSPKCILDKQRLILNNIRLITKKHKAEIKIVISPLYDQMKLNVKDLECLRELFGDVNVFDFSGINRFTNDYKNFYESSHYRPHVAKEIMELVYSRQ